MNIDNTIECKRILSHINKQVCEVSVKFNKNQVSRVLYSLFLEILIVYKERPRTKKSQTIGNP